MPLTAPSSRAGRVATVPFSSTTSASRNLIDELPLLITRIRISTLKSQSLRLSHHLNPTKRSRSLILSIGRIKDALNEFIQHGIELSIGLLGRQPFYQRPRKARDEAVISAQTVVGLFPRIAARERDD